MSEVEEEISPFLSNLSLSRQAVSLVDPFRDDPTAEDGIDPDIEFSDTSEEGFIMKDISFMFSKLSSDDTNKRLLCTCTNCKEMPTVLESLCCQAASRIRPELMTGSYLQIVSPQNSLSELGRH